MSGGGGGGSGVGRSGGTESADSAGVSLLLTADRGSKLGVALQQAEGHTKPAEVAAALLGPHEAGAAAASTADGKVPSTGAKETAEADEDAAAAAIGPVGAAAPGGAPPTVSGVVATLQAGVAGAGARLLAYASVCFLMTFGLLAADAALVVWMVMTTALPLAAALGARAVRGPRRVGRSRPRGCGEAAAGAKADGGTDGGERP